MKINGTIEINVDARTITIKLENGAYCIEFNSKGAAGFLTDEIDNNTEKDMYPIGYFRFE